MTKVLTPSTSGRLSRTTSGCDLGLFPAAHVRALGQLDYTGACTRRSPVQSFIIGSAVAVELGASIHQPAHACLHAIVQFFQEHSNSLAVASSTNVQLQTEPKSPLKPGDNIQFMEHLTLPFRHASREALKVCHPCRSDVVINTEGALCIPCSGSHLSSKHTSMPMQFELLQKSQGGDLVLGECKMRVADVVAAGAVHSWFPFMDAADPELKAGELLMAIQARGVKGKDASKYRDSRPQMGKGTVEQSVTVSSTVRLSLRPAAFSSNADMCRLLC